MRRALLLVVLVLVPLVAVTAVALSSDGDTDDSGAAGRSSPSTAAPDEAGADERDTSTAPTGTAPPGADDPTVPRADEGDGPGPETTVATGPTTPVTAPEVPSRPGVAGPEGDRPVTTYPQPTVPEGGCPSRGGTVVITLGDRPTPACVSVGADQTIEFHNRSGHELSVVAEQVNEVVPAGSTFAVVAGSAFPEGRSTFWSPGRPDLSGIVQVG